MSDPITDIEHREAMASLADLSHTYYVELVAQGFDEPQALTLTLGWLQAISSPRGGS